MSSVQRAFLILAFTGSFAAPLFAQATAVRPSAVSKSGFVAAQSPAVRAYKQMQLNNDFRRIQREQAALKARAANIPSRARNEPASLAKMRQEAQASLAQVDREAAAIKNKLDSLSEMGEMESLRLQMAMDRLSKLMATLSNLMKKISDTSNSIVQNMR